MSQPATGPYTEIIYDDLRPLAYADPSYGYHLLSFVYACSAAFEDVYAWARDQGDQPGWAMFLDLDQCPTIALRWLGQFVGVYIPPQGTDQTLEQFDADARAKIARHEGWGRGKVSTIVAIAKSFLTGNKSVYLSERSTSAYHYVITVYDSEAPVDTTAMLAALTAAKPAGLTFTLNVVPGQTYEQLRDNHTDYADVDATYDTYDEVRNDEP